TAQAFTRYGQVNIRNARHAGDPRPLEEGCPCPACRQHSRAYLHHLVKAEEILGLMLLTWHNLTYYQSLMRQLRDAISENRLGQFADGFKADQTKGDIGSL
ncbi:MAG: tRNA-guanine transglycosylase, partial [Rhodospirillales bacterium]